MRSIGRPRDGRREGKEPHCCAALRTAVSMLGRQRDLTAPQRDFILRSQANRRRSLLLRLLSLSLAIDLVVIVVAGVWIVRQQNIARRDALAGNALLSAEVNYSSARDPSPVRLALDLRAFRTVDDERTRSALREWYRALRFSSTILPADSQELAVEAVSPDGSLALAAAGTDEMDVLDMDRPRTALTRLRIPHTSSGIRAVAWLSPGALAMGDRDGIEIRDARDGRLLRKVPAELDRVITDPGGRWLGWGRTGDPVFHLLDLRDTAAVTRTVRLPAPLGATRQGSADDIQVRAVLDDGSLVGARDAADLRVNDRAAAPFDLPFGTVLASPDGRSVVVRCAEDVGMLLQAVATGQAVATQRVADAHCDQTMGGESLHAAFSPDGRSIALTTYDPALESSVGPVQATDTPPTVEVGEVGTELRRVRRPRGYLPTHVSAEAGGVLRVVLESTSGVTVLRIPPADPMERAVGTSADALLSPDRRYVVLTQASGLTEVWDTAAASPPPRSRPDPRPAGRSRTGSVSLSWPQTVRSW